jgi:hypothetical protein
MISIEVFGKTCSGAKKTLGWEKLSEKFRKWLQKPWSSIYSTEMFSKRFRDKWKLGIWKKVLVQLEKGIGVSL